MGTVHLTDFGLAKATTTGSKYTRTGQALGTPAYMSPEQARGETDLTPATDVWALGCILYELLAGRRAFEGETPAAVIGAVLTRPPPRLAGTPAGVWDLVAGCLQQTPGCRPPTASVLAADCNRVLSGGRPHWRPPSHGRRLAALVTAACIAVAVAVSSSPSRPGLPAVPPPTTAHEEARRLADDGWGRRLTDLSAAEAVLARACAQDPARATSWLQLGLVRWARGRDAEAVTAWARVPAEAPEGARAEWLRGLVAFVRHVGTQDVAHLEPARSAWIRASGAGGASARWARAGLALIAHDFGLVRERLAGAGDWEAAVLVALAEGHSENPSRDPAAARQAYTCILEEGLRFPWALNNRGQLRAKLGDLDGARADFDEVVAGAPGHVEALVNRGLLRARRGDLDGARDDYDQAVAAQPGRAEARLNRGLLRERRGDLAGARADYDAALVARPGYADALANRGILRAEQGDVAGASTDYDAALATDPDHPGARVNRAVLRAGAGDLEGALTDLDRVLAIHPDLHEARVSRGLVRMRHRDPEGAVADLALAVAAVPDDAEAHEALGTARMAREDWGGAAAAFRRFLALVPEAPEASAVRARLVVCDARLAGRPDAKR